MEKFKFDVSKNTLTLSAAFIEAMNDPESEEYALVNRLTHDFPSLRVVRKTHAKPTRYHNSDGTITAHNKHDRLTYERMERFMNSLPDGAEYLKAYTELREKAEAMCLSPYSAVSAWFMAQFPEYRKNPLFYLDYKPNVIDFSAVLKKAKGKDKTA